MCVIEQSPVIDTRRLRLRAPAPQDVADIARLCDDPDIAWMTARMPHPYGREDAERFVAQVAGADPRREHTFLIEHEDHGPVGMIGLFHDVDPWPELGYWIGRAFWGRGLATEAAQGVLAWARRSWGKRAVAAGYFSDNPASGRVLEKAGFLPTGEVRRLFSRARGAEAPCRRMVWLA